MLAWLDEASVDKCVSISSLRVKGRICRQGTNDVSSLQLGDCIENRVNLLEHALEVFLQAITLVIKYMINEILSIFIVACHKRRSELVSPQHLVCFPIRECSKYDWIPIR